ncbi:MAG: hypothetical protein DRI54_08300 [Bacteroidetes bacterium]|nr:MAG: hypothetical protein DRI54_08300 [Bacteroidota bacterium]
MRFLNAILLLFVLTFSVQGILAQDAKEENKKEHKKKKDKDKEKTKISLIDSTDGALDVGEFLDMPEGILPIPVIITEPAIGYGGGLAVIMIKENKFTTPEKKLQPNISGVFGFGTQSKTWGVGIFHAHSFKHDKIRYTGVLAKTTINIKFYGVRSDNLDAKPVLLKMNNWFTMQRVIFRIKDTDLFIGPQYSYFQTKNSIDSLLSRPVIPGFEKINGKSAISMVTLLIQYDSRDNIFTPNKGLSTGVSAGYSSTFLGSSNDYWNINPYFLAYIPISKKVFSAYRFDSQFAFGDVLLYAKPFIEMRGVPAMRYQGNYTMLVQTEWRGYVYRRWSLNGFVGTGKAFDDFADFNDANWIYDYGAGFRYLMARRYDLNVGMDFAWSNNGDFAFYIQVGTAWNK